MSNPVLAALGRPFRLGIAGGAAPSLIGPVHRIAAVMDQRFTINAAVLSSRPERSRIEGQAIGLPAERCYGSVEEMIQKEHLRADGIEALAIITPNDSHARYLRLALGAGLDVMIEKPLCNDLDEAMALQQAVEASGCAVALTHTYSGYPMVREMRARILAGEIGAVRLVQVEYLSGGLATAVESAPDADRRWRLKPDISGPSLVLGDIGTHVHHMVSFVTGLPFESVSAEVGTCCRGERCRTSRKSVSASQAARAAGSTPATPPPACRTMFCCAWSARPVTSNGCIASIANWPSPRSTEAFA